MSEKSKRCSCGAAAYLEVKSREIWYGKRPRIITEWKCNQCVLLSNHGLVGFICSKKCNKARGRLLKLELRPVHHVIWFSLCQIAAINWKTKTSTPQKPKCPWCGKYMKPYREKKI